MGGRPFHSSMAYGSAGAGGLLFLGPLLMIGLAEYGDVGYRSWAASCSTH